MVLMTAEPIAFPSISLFAEFSFVLGGHAAHDGQSVFGCGAAVFTSARLADSQLRMLPATPMYCQQHITGFIIDIDDDVSD